MQYASNVKIFCKVIGMSMHFFLLCTFTWTTSLSVYVFILILQLKLNTSLASANLRFLKNLQNHKALAIHCFCWGLPFLISLTCILLDAVLSKGCIGYGDSIGEGDHCWIGNLEGLRFGFLVPLGISFHLNFILTVGAFVTVIIVTKSNGRSRFGFPDLFFIFARIFISVGSQWGLGFLFHFVKNSVLELLFILTASFQGFFVFLAMLSIKKTRNEVKDLLVFYFNKFSFIRSNQVAPQLNVQQQPDQQLNMQPQNVRQSNAQQQDIPQIKVQQQNMQQQNEQNEQQLNNEHQNMQQLNAHELNIELDVQLPDVQQKLAHQLHKHQQDDEQKHTQLQSVSQQDTYSQDRAQDTPIHRIQNIEGQAPGGPGEGPDGAQRGPRGGPEGARETPGKKTKKRVRIGP
jgi:hypothetical protein